MNLSREAVESTLTVIEHVRQSEHDQDHVSHLASAYAAIISEYGDIVTHRDDAPTQEDVDRALALLDEYGESYEGLDDTWTWENDLDEMRQVVELESQINGRLP